MLHGNTSGLVLNMHYFVKPVLVGALRLSVFMVVSWPRLAGMVTSLSACRWIGPQALWRL